MRSKKSTISGRFCHYFPLITLILCALVPTDLLAQTIEPGIAEKTKRMDSLLTVMIEHGLFNGSVLVAEDGKAIYQKSFGMASLESKRPNSDTTQFNIASVSKPFVSVAVLQLVQNARVNLDQSFASFFPEFPYKEVTIRQLLNHTSGLPQLERYEEKKVREQPDKRITTQEAYADLLELKPPVNFSPGDNWRYNNTNYLLLALLIEKVSGMPFASYMKKHVFLPAGMKHTYVRPVDAPNTPRYMLPTMYTFDYKNVDSVNPNKYFTYFHLGGIHGPGNIVSTLQDLLQFDRALYSEKLIREWLLNEAYTPVVLNNGKPFFMGTSTRTYGLGWNIYHNKTAPIYKFVFHDGHIVGLSTVLHRNPEKKQTIILYDNYNNPPIILMVALNNILNGQPLGKVRVTSSLARHYGHELITKGADQAITKFHEMRSDTTRYHLEELEMNALGYELLSKDDHPDHLTLSLEAFKVNTLLFPKSANAYDSYADALMKNGKSDEALRMYRKSLDLNPNNENAKRALQKIAPAANR